MRLSNSIIKSLSHNQTNLVFIFGNIASNVIDIKLIVIHSTP